MLVKEMPKESMKIRVHNKLGLEEQMEIVEATFSGIKMGFNTRMESQ